jgi:hypothetical protein
MIDIGKESHPSMPPIQTKDNTLKLHQSKLSKRRPSLRSQPSLDTPHWPRQMIRVIKGKSSFSFQYTVYSLSIPNASCSYSQSPLVNCHPARYWSMLYIWELSHVVLLCCFLPANLPLHDMWLQSLVKIGHAYASISYREDE